MRKISIPLIIMVFALSACLDDGPAAPPSTGNGGSLYDGTFNIADTLVVNTCVSPPVPPPRTVTVAIDGDSIWIDSYRGAWDPDTKTGTGISPEVTVPVDPPACNAYYTVTVTITFVDPDYFIGTYSVAYRKDAGCPNPDPCSYTYKIGGTR
jgi:hypothetical protein